jgi:hypothetical protein
MSTPKMNMNGDRMCDMIKCRKHKNLETTEQGVFCKQHLKPKNRILPSNLDLECPNGTPLCHAFGCQQTKHLMQMFGGKFCRVHQPIILQIRRNIFKCKSIGFHDLELLWRTEESHLRKQMDQGHWQRISFLTKLIESQQKEPNPTAYESFY